jgi:hypothetical protein
MKSLVELRVRKSEDVEGALGKGDEGRGIELGADMEEYLGREGSLGAGHV